MASASRGAWCVFNCVVILCIAGLRHTVLLQFTLLHHSWITTHFLFAHTMTRTVLSRSMYQALQAKWITNTDYFYASSFVDYYQKLGWDLRIDSAPQTLAYSVPTAQLALLLLTLWIRIWFRYPMKLNWKWWASGMIMCCWQIMNMLICALGMHNQGGTYSMTCCGPAGSCLLINWFSLHWCCEHHAVQQCMHHCYKYNGWLNCNCML